MSPGATSTSSRSHSSSTKEPSRPKLRDSCDACANSKLKCPKEKPTCARCARKGIPCVYGTTRRVGRKSFSQWKAQAESEAVSPTSSSVDMSSSRDSIPKASYPDEFDTEMLFGNDYLPRHCGSSSGTSISDATSTLQSMDDFLPMNPGDPSVDINSYISTPASPFTTGNFAGDFFGQQPTFMGEMETDRHPHTSHPFGSMLLFDNTLAGLPQSSSHHSVFVANPLGSPGSLDSLSCCLFEVIVLVKELFPRSSSQLQKSKGFMPGSSSRETVQSIISMNQNAIDAILKMLQCPCSRDRFLLSTVSLVVFKILNWYAAAARLVQPCRDSYSDNMRSLLTFANSSKHSSDNIAADQFFADLPPTDTSDLEGEDPAYMAAQRVLSELYKVQGLIKQLSRKLREQSMAPNATGSNSRLSMLAEGLEAEDKTSSFPSSILEQLDMDLQKGLKSLTEDIRKILRRE